MLVVRLCIFCFLVFLCLFHFDSPSSRVCFVHFCFPCLLSPVCIYCLCPRVFHRPVFQPSSWVPGWVLSMWVFSPDTYAFLPLPGSLQSSASYVTLKAPPGDCCLIWCKSKKAELICMLNIAVVFHFHLLLFSVTKDNSQVESCNWLFGCVMIIIIIFK